MKVVLGNFLEKYIKYILIFVFSSFLIKSFFSYEGDGHVLESIKYLFLPLVDIYLTAFQNPNTSLLLFLIILFLCIMCMYWIYFVKYIPLNKNLDLSIDRAKRVQAAVEAKKISALEGLNDFKNDEILKSSILKVINNFKFNKKNISGSFSEFISLNMLETKGFPLRIISAFPGYFVGVGLIFTFLGLVAALYFSAQGMKSGNYEDARASMMHLLYASSFKFTTSIAGVFSSLLISILYKHLVHSLSLKVSKLEEILDTMFYSLGEEQE